MEQKNTIKTIRSINILLTLTDTKGEPPDLTTST